MVNDIASLETATSYSVKLFRGQQEQEAVVVGTLLASIDAVTPNAHGANPDHSGKLLNVTA